MEDTVTLKELCAVALRRGRLILCVAAVFALLAGGFQLIKLVKEAGSAENSEEKIEERYQAALEAYEKEKENLQEQLAKAEKRLASQQEYNDNSLKMRIDPYNKAVTTISFAITDVDDTSFQQVFLLEGTPVDYIISKIRNHYLAYWNSLDLERALQNCTYAGNEDKYLREIVFLANMDGGGLTLTAYGESEQDAQELADAVYACLTAVQPTIESSAYPHAFTVINKVTKILVDEGLEESQKSNRNNITTYQTNIESLQQRLNDLAEPEREKGYSGLVIAKSTLKWAVIGAAAGIFVALMWAFLEYVFCGYIESIHGVETKHSLVFLGSSAQEKSVWSKLSCRVLGERVWKSEVNRNAYLAENLKFYLLQGNKTAILSTLPIDETTPSIQTLIQTLSAQEHTARFLSCASQNPNTIGILQDCDNVILAERIGTSRWDKLLENEALVKRIGKKICGFVAV